LAGLVKSLVSHMREVLTASSILTVDDTMAGWQGRVGPHGGGKALPSSYFIRSKPTPHGAQIRNMACRETHIIFSLEIMERADDMAQKTYNKEFGNASAAQVVRLLENANCVGKGKMVVEDSAFGSVRTAIELAQRGSYFVGPVKNASKFYPKKKLQEERLGKGQWTQYKAEVGGKAMLALGYKRDQVETYIATTSSSVAVMDARNVDRAGKKMPYPEILQTYYSNHSAVDIFNHLLSSLNCDGFKTHSGTLRVFMTLVGVCLVNAYNCYRCDVELLKEDAEYESMRAFADPVIKKLLTNTIGAAPQPAAARARAAAGAAPAAAAVPARALAAGDRLRVFSRCEIVPYPRDQGKGLCEQCGRRTRFYCTDCSSTRPRSGRVIWLCGLETKGRRQCVRDHIVSRLKQGR